MFNALQMTYNLRNRNIAEVLRAEDEEEDDDFGGRASDSEDDYHESDCDSEYRPARDSEDEDDREQPGSESEEDGDPDVESENASSSNRLLSSGARGRPKTKLYGKNGFVWNTRQHGARRSDRSNNQDDDGDFVPKPRGPALGCTTFEEFWDVLFSKEIIDIIVENTNIQIERHCAPIIASGTEQSYHRHTDAEEIRAFIAILYYGGAWKSSGASHMDLWDSMNGVNFYRSVMSIRRYELLASCLRFDDKETRNRNNRFAPIQKIWDIFIKNCTDSYNPSSKCTVDETLLDFRGRAKFRVYMKSKPDKYGLQFKALNDAETAYLIYAVPYLGTIELHDKLDDELTSEYYLRVTCNPIHGTGRFLTCDNWFSTIPGFLLLGNAPYSLKLTGTVRKNKREVPAEMKVASKEVPGTKYCFSDNGLTLVSHTPKKNKIVLVMSNYNVSTDITDGKPNMILHYNKTKGGTDCFDWLLHSHTVSRRTARWPMRIFFGILDMASVNSRILLKCFNRNLGNNSSKSMKKCLDGLIIHLVTPHLQNRLASATLQRNLRSGISSILKRPEQRILVENQRPEFEKRTRCALCPTAADHKTKRKCPSCLRGMCDDHRVWLCIDCGGGE